MGLTFHKANMGLKWCYIPFYGSMVKGVGTFSYKTGVGATVQYTGQRTD